MRLRVIQLGSPGGMNLVKKATDINFLKLLWTVMRLYLGLSMIKENLAHIARFLQSKSVIRGIYVW